MKVVAIDPGMSTGIVEAEVADDTVLVQARHQMVGGLDGVTEYLWQLVDRLDSGGYLRVVCEKFSPLPTARAYRLNELEPIRIEGAIGAMFGLDLVTFQRTMSLTIAGSHGNPRANKKAADDYLRDCGLWTTGKQIGAKDADDVNAAMKHLVAYGRANNWPDPHDWKMND